MNEIIIKCDECDQEYFGEFYDSKEKKGPYGKYQEVTYQSQCTVCDKPIFTTQNIKY